MTEAPAPPDACPACARPLAPPVGAVVRFCPACGAALAPVAAALAVPDPAGRLGFGMALVFYVLAFLPLVVLLALVDEPEPQTLLYFDAFHLALGLVGVLAYRGEVLAAFGRPRLSLRGLGLVLAGVGATLALAYVLVELLGDADEPTITYYQAHGLPLVLTLLNVAAVPAITEEILFRVLVQRGLERAFPPGTAVFVGACLFAIVHMAPVSLVHLTLLGVVLGELRRRSGSVWPCMLTHAAYNSLVVLIWW